VSNINVGALQNNLQSINSNINAVGDLVSDVQAQVGRVSQDLASTNHELVALRHQFDEFVLQAERTANVQRSEVKLGVLKDDLEREFGHYGVVRRSSLGTLQAFDAGLVSNRSVQQVSEELMIQSPRYWLAPALVALAAWSRDDEELAKRAVDEAFSRDRQKTSLFFALVLRRQNRLDSATRWLRQYFTSLDPRALHREFAVVLEGVAQDAFGPAGRNLVLDQLSAWSGLLREESAIAEEQVIAWQQEISIQRGSVDDDLYPYLSAMSPQWGDVKRSLEHASALGFTHDKYRAILDAQPPASAKIEDQMDDLLEILITEFDTEELPRRREISFHEAVVDSAGDLVRAREAAEAEAEALQETLDAVSLVTQTAIRPQNLGISSNTQRLAIGANKADFVLGTGRYAADYRRVHRSEVDLTLGPNHSNYASTLGFSSWTVSTQLEQGQAERSLFDTWDAVLAAHIASVSFKRSTLVLPIVATVVALLIGLIGGPVLMLILTLVVGGGAYWFVRSRKNRADAAVAEAERAREAAKAVSRDQYRSAVAEWVDSGIVYREADARETDLLSLIDSWPTLTTETTASAA